MKWCLPGFVASIVCMLGMTAVAGQYEATFDSFAEGATNLSPVGELFSNQLGTATRVVEASGKELQLTANGMGSTFSAFRLPNLDPGSGVCAFSAKWNAAIVGESPRADGLSFNFGPLGNSASFFTNTSNPNEGGFGVGLSVGLVTFGGNNPGYYVRVNGAVVPGGFVAKPDTDWGELNPARHFFEVDWHYFTGLTLRVNGVAVFTNLPTPGFVPDIGHRFVFGARTGGFDQQVTLDNILVVTGGVLSPVAAAAPYYFNSENAASGEGAAQAFDGNVGTKWLAVTSTGHIGASLSSAKTIRAYALSSANDIPIRDPKSWNFETGNDGSTWTNRGNKSLQFFANRFEKRAFLVTSPAANSKFRLNITANNGSTLTQLAELQAWELTPGPAFFKVFSLGDSGADSLRNALTNAASTPGQAVITFSSGLAGGTISPASVISINDANGVAVDASNLIGGIVLNGGNARRILNNAGTGQVILNHLKFTGGNGADPIANGNAGALLAATGSNTVISRCAFSNNAVSSNGGAIFNAGTMTITDSLFEANTAGFQSGAIQNEQILTMSNCTITGNTAGSYGGGIQSVETLTLRHCTISGNAASVSVNAWGGGLDVFEATLTLENCIISGNTSRGAAQDLSADTATLNHVGRNIVGVRDSFANVTETGPAPLQVDPLLAPIGDYGGPTRTLALKRNSPARDASLSSTSSWDQRGFPRNGVPDLGAYEAGNALLTNYTAWIWESLPAFATAGQHALEVDFDGDGQTNATEWFFFTDPGSSSSFHSTAQSEITRQGNLLIISFPSITGRTYTLWQNNTLTGPWQNTGLPAISGNNAVQQFSVPAQVNGVPKRFFRVVLSQP